MDEHGTDAPFARHQRTAERLVRTLQQALEPQFTGRGSITREEFGRTVDLLLEHADKVMPLFVQNCRACLDHPLPPRVQMAMFQPDGRRRDYVTRLLFSSVHARLPESVDPLTGAIFPRVVVPGLQANLAALFYDKEWEAMNADACTVFQKIGSASDQELWSRIGQDEALPIVVDALFVRVLLRFRQFAFQRQTFMRRMIEVMRERRFTFTEEHFVLLFESLFVRLRESLKTELGRARMDTRYGDDTSSHLLRIFDEFERHRLELSLPVRGLSGAQRSPVAARRALQAHRASPLRRD